ncbi:MAG: hypothetical protein HRU13_11390, partial [Phycisphaerales bacterium]|nr:hypothetical protein [Phycisphaerales bacterium]
AGDGTGEQSDALDPWQRELMDLPQREGELPDEAMRTVAEWFGEGRETPGQGPAAIGDDVREAARGAQEAIERERVPRRRSELIRRVFERYAERLGQQRQGSSASGGSTSGAGAGS